MKIAFYSGGAGQKHASRIIDILKKHAPHHQYNHCAHGGSPDLWHCMIPRASVSFMPFAARSVISLYDVRFVTSPHIFSLPERLFLLPIYRYHCRHAARLITGSDSVKNKIVELLDVDSSSIDVLPLLGAAQCGAFGCEDPTSEDLLAVRASFELPDSYILVAGEIDTMHEHATILHAILSLPFNLNVVLYGRRTTHSDVLLQMVRDRGVVDRVQFIYEIDSLQLSALYRMALVVVYMPAFDSSILPIVEALRQGVPMILSDTSMNREAAGSAALFVPLYDQAGIEAALKMIIYDQSYRGQLIAQCLVESERYSEESVAESLSAIYDSI